MEIFQGKEGFGSIAIGSIHILDFDEAETDSTEGKFDCDRELEKYRKAAKIVLESIKADEENAIHYQKHKEMHDLAMQRSIIEEHQFSDAVTGRVINQKCSAADAVIGAGRYFENVYSSMQESIIKPSRSDMKAVSSLLVEYLNGSPSLLNGLDKPCILAAKSLSASEFLQLDKDKLLGLIIENSSANSHMAILAKSTGIPAIFGCELCVGWDGREAVTDGGWRALYVDPDKSTKNDMKERANSDRKESRRLQKLKGVECVTLDGIRIHLLGNISSPKEIIQLSEYDAEGIGLYRSEVSYIGRNRPPSEDELFEEYRTVMTGMDGRGVIIRTLDLGNDKNVPYLNIYGDKNDSLSALGMRGIRLSLRQPDLFCTQLKALMRAAVYGDLSIMYPMVTAVKEILMAHDIMDGARHQLDSEGAMYKEPKTGTMIETPAAALISDDLAKNSDFLSIGTNDLTQYTLGVDRENAELSDICDYHHPAIVKMVRIVTENAHKNNIPAGICGELASDLKLTRFFLELGVDSLSVMPADILKLRNNIINMKIREN